MKPIILAAALAASSATAWADPVIVAPQGAATVREVPAGGVVVTEPPAAVIERRGPYDSQPVLNTQSRERTPNVGAGTSRSKDANQG